MKFNPYRNFGFLTDKVSRLIHARVEAVKKDKSYSFSNACLGILAELWMKDGIKQQDLANALIRNKSSINKMLLSLEKDGLIYREIDSVDKRQNRIYLTPEGKRFRSFVKKKAKRGESLATQGLDESEVETAKKVLKVMYENLLNDHNSTI
jgi:DNA-binding MarR family transcriptional regulator